MRRALARIGDRRQLVTLQTQTAVSDGQGGQVVTWSALGSEWALVEPMRVFGKSESLQSDQMNAELITSVTIPFRSDLSAADRVVLGGRTMQITSLPDMTSRREELRLLCLEVQA